MGVQTINGRSPITLDQRSDRAATEHPLRIAHLLAGGSYGGLESVVSSLTRGLVERGHDCEVFAILDPGLSAENTFLDEIRRAGVRITPLQVGHRSYLRERRVLSELLSRSSPDLLHTHGYRADVQGIAAARRSRVPSVSTAHGFAGGNLKNRFFEYLQVRSLRRADRVIGVSGPIVERLERSGVPADRLDCVPNAWEPSVPLLPRATARGLLGLDCLRPVIGWVGRLSGEKGCDLFVRAIAATRVTETVACIVGDGPERASMESLARELRIVDRIHFAGAVPLASRIFSAFDVFCLSSRTEGTPIVLLEAMNARIPVVATRVGGVPYMLTMAEGWLAERVDPVAIAESLDKAIEKGIEQTVRVEAASERVRRRYAVGPWIDRYIGIYTELTARPHPVRVSDHREHLDR